MELLPFIQAIQGRDEKFFQLIKGLQELTFGESALDVKTKLLISLAVDACSGVSEGVSNISAMLRQMGTSEEEIAEVLRIVYFAIGSKVLITSLAADQK